MGLAKAVQVLDGTKGDMHTGGRREEGGLRRRVGRIKDMPMELPCLHVLQHAPHSGIRADCAYLEANRQKSISSSAFASSCASWYTARLLSDALRLPVILHGRASTSTALHEEYLGTTALWRDHLSR